MTVSTVPLGELAVKLQDGPFGSNLKSAHYVPDGVRVVRLQNIGVGHFMDRDRAFISPEHFNTLRKHECRPGDVLLATLGDPILRAAQLPDDVPLALNKADCIQVRCDPERVSARYLTHYLNSDRALSHAEALAHGQTRARVNLTQLRTLPIPLPPIEEQRRIAAVLDAADGLRAKRRQAIAKLDTLTQAIFLDMFGDPVANERDWPSRALADVCKKIQIGPFGSLLHQSDYVSGGVPLINPMHIVDGSIRSRDDQTVTPEKLKTLQSFLLEPSDVVMGRRGEMGRVAIVGERETGYLCGSGSLYFRPDPDQIVPEYLAAALSGRRGRRNLENSAQGVTMANLNSDIVEKFRLGVAPIDAQLQFCTALSTHAKSVATQQRQIAQLDALFTSLQQRSFRGEL